MNEEEYIDKNAAYDRAALCDWFISSTDGRPPVWTKEHIDELLDGFLVIPRSVTAEDVKPVLRGRWNVDATGAVFCSVCGEYALETSIHRVTGWFPHYCPHCGAENGGDC